MIAEKYTNLPTGVAKSILFVCIATSMIGLSLGSLAAGFQIPLWIPLLLSVSVLAGAAEFTFIGMIATGANPITAAFAGILINLRHLPFGLSVSSFIHNNKFRYLACHIMNDESVIFGLSQPTEAQQRAAYWLCGTGIAIAWPVGVVIGYWIARNLPYAEQAGLDAMFPAILFALTFKALKKTSTRKSAISGSAISLICIPFFPAGLPVLMSLCGLWFGRNK